MAHEKGQAVSIGVVQINPLIGDVRANTKKIVARIEDLQSESSPCDIIIFPELALTGYPPRDLLLFRQKHIIDECQKALGAIAQAAGDATIIVGSPSFSGSGRKLRNSAYILDRYGIRAKVDKMFLPSYDVFDEPRYFEPEDRVVPHVFTLKGVRVAITICEDIWTVDPGIASHYLPPYPLDHIQKEGGCDLLINLSASPWYKGKFQRRQEIVQKVAKILSCPVLQSNQVGAQDDLIFDGRSIVVDCSGAVLDTLRPFQEDARVYSCIAQDGKVRSMQAPSLATYMEEEEELFQALTLGIRDYFLKQGFSRAIVGLSGGIDSAIVLALACSALGSKNILAVMMPTVYTSEESIEDAQQVAHLLGVELRQISVQALSIEAASLIGIGVDPSKSLNDVQQLAWENIQSRSRAILLMAISNMEGRLPLATSNKSELATGYSTIYGDAVGAMSPIGDLFKVEVYRLARWIQKHVASLPERVLTKEPTAELKIGQKDSDTLLSYPVLDPVLETVLNPSPEKEVWPEHAYDYEKRLYRNEYKRRQAPFALKVSPVAFGSGRRFPLVHGYHFFRDDESDR